MKKLWQNNEGAALISVIIVLPFLIAIALNYTQLGTNNIILSRKDIFRTQTQMVADAGLDYGMQQITASTVWAGTGGDVVFDTLNNVKTTYNVTVSDVNADKKIMTSVAKLYRPSTSTTPQTTITINADLRKVTGGNFSIVTGVGGLIMENSSKVLGGNVYVNGTVYLKNTAQIGLLTTPVTLNVAHQSCPEPPDATYPRLCASGENGQPITIENTAHIYGTVNANNQTSTAGMTNPGLIGSSGVPTLPLPPHDRNAQKAAVTSTQTGSAASCTANNGTNTWPANLKINGDVIIEKNCVVTMQGDVWVTGKLDLKNSGKIVVSNSLGATRPNLMTDGSKASLNNTSTIQNNSSGTGIQLISYFSLASCSPDCADITGLDLKNSRDYLSIELDNSGSGPGTIFYARWTKVQVGNSGQIGALVGQTVHLKNTATITFGTSAGFGTEYWILDGYRRSF